MRRAVVAILLVATASAHASPAQELDRARTSFKARDWQSAIPTLNNLLYPRVQLGQQNDAIEAYVLLGAAHFEIGDRDRAKEEFEKALQLDPESSITTLTFSEGAVRLFEQTKEDIKARIERDRERKRVAELAERLEAYKKSLIVYETRPYYVNFIPFGAGQFQQHRNGPGLFFAITQGVTGVTSAGIFIYLARTYGLASNSVPIADGPSVRRLQQIEIATGALFFGFYAWGVVDALLHYKPRAQIQGDDSLIPEELRVPTKPTVKASFRERLKLAPMFSTESGSTTVGIGIGWEN